MIKTIMYHDRANSNLTVGLTVIMNCIVNQKERKYLILHLNGYERKFVLGTFFELLLHNTVIYVDFFLSD